MIISPNFTFTTDTLPRQDIRLVFIYSLSSSSPEVEELKVDEQELDRIYRAAV